MISALGDYMELVICLLDNKAWPETKDNHGMTAAMHAQKKGNAEVVNVLEEAERLRPALENVIHTRSLDGAPEKTTPNQIGAMQWCSVDKMCEPELIDFHGTVSVINDNPRIFMNTHEAMV